MTEQTVESIMIGIIIGGIFALIAMPWAIRAYIWYVDKVLGDD